MCCDCCSVRQQKIWVFTFGSVFTVIGIVLIAASSAIVDAVIKSELILSPSSYSFGKWEVTPIPIYLTFYLFNWTNPHEINNPNVKPNFEQIGPYMFRETKVKEDLLWNKTESTVTFYGRRTWHFDPEVSNGSLDDVIIVPNFATVAASKISRKMRKFMRKIVNFGLNREGGSLAMIHTAGEWMFDGFYDDVFDFAERLHSRLIPIYSDHFGWFYERNNSKEAEGTYTIHTGKSDVTRLGDLIRWNGSDHTNFWRGDCGKINGSTGELFSPDKSWDEPISIFLSDSARFINLFPQERINYRGVDVWVYNSTDQTFDSGYIAPDTECFCVKGRECPLNGVIDFSRVTYRAPTYLSHPHFYMTDARYRENTTGLQPKPAEHGLYVIMEPTLGIPIELNGQVMLSVLVERDEYIDFLKDVAHDFYAPLFVVQMKAEITEGILKFVKLALAAPKIGMYVGIALTSIGVIMIIIGIWLTKAHKWRGDIPQSKQESILEDTTTRNSKTKVKDADDTNMSTLTSQNVGVSKNETTSEPSSQNLSLDKSETKTLDTAATVPQNDSVNKSETTIANTTQPAHLHI